MNSPMDAPIKFRMPDRIRQLLLFTKEKLNELEESKTQNDLEPESDVTVKINKILKDSNISGKKAGALLEQLTKLFQDSDKTQEQMQQLKQIADGELRQLLEENKEQYRAYNLLIQQLKDSDKQVDIKLSKILLQHRSDILSEMKATITPIIELKDQIAAQINNTVQKEQADVEMKEEFIDSVQKALEQMNTRHDEIEQVRQKLGNISDDVTNAVQRAFFSDEDVEMFHDEDTDMTDESIMSRLSSTIKKALETQGPIQRENIDQTVNIFVEKALHQLQELVDNNFTSRLADAITTKELVNSQMIVLQKQEQVLNDKQKLIANLLEETHSKILVDVPQTREDLLTAFKSAANQVSDENNRRIQLVYDQRFQELNVLANQLLESSKKLNSTSNQTLFDATKAQVDSLFEQTKNSLYLMLNDASTKNDDLALKIDTATQNLSSVGTLSEEKSLEFKKQLVALIDGALKTLVERKNQSDDLADQKQQSDLQTVIEKTASNLQKDIQKAYETMYAGIKKDMTELASDQTDRSKEILDKMKEQFQVDQTEKSQVLQAQSTLIDETGKSLRNLTGQMYQVLLEEKKTSNDSKELSAKVFTQYTADVTEARDALALAIQASSSSGTLINKSSEALESMKRMLSEFQQSLASSAVFSKNQIDSAAGQLKLTDDHLTSAVETIGEAALAIKSAVDNSSTVNTTVDASLRTLSKAINDQTQYFVNQNADSNRTVLDAFQTVVRLLKKIAVNQSNINPPKKTLDYPSYIRKRTALDRAAQKTQEVQIQQPKDQPIPRQNNFVQDVDDSEDQEQDPTAAYSQQSESSEEDDESIPIPTKTSGKGKTNLDFDKLFAPCVEISSRVQFMTELKRQIEHSPNGTIHFGSMEDFFQHQSLLDNERVSVKTTTKRDTHHNIPEFASTPVIGMCIAGFKKKIDLQLVACLPRTLFFLEIPRKHQIRTQCYGLLQLVLMGLSSVQIYVGKKTEGGYRFLPVLSLLSSNGQPLQKGGFNVQISDLDYVDGMQKWMCKRAVFPSFIQKEAYARADECLKALRLSFKSPKSSKD